MNAKIQDFNLWPSPRSFTSSNRVWNKVKQKNIEDTLSSMYPGAFPLLVSSARASINLIIHALNIGRSDCVKIPFYSSHCVIDAISRVTDPVLPNCNVNCSLEIIYHQWGYISENSSNIRLIEDAVDSLCQPGKIIFPSGGDYEIWSLPKILGTFDGAVIWTKDEKHKDELIRIIEGRSNPFPLKLLRNLSRKSTSFYNYWNGAEASLGGKLTNSSLRQIKAAVELIPQLVTDRKNKLNIFYENIPVWAKLYDGRLPCVIPLEISNTKIKLLSEIGIGCFPRRFTAEKLESSSKNTLRTVIPIPIHQDIKIELLEKVKKSIL